MGHKRPREVPTVITRRAEIYEDLASIDEKIRLKAAHALLTEIVPHADFDQLQEILRRLIRGLCSGRKAARLGFSVALTEFLSTLLGSESPNPLGLQGPSGVVDTLIHQTQVSSGLAGQEYRDHHLGRLFGAEAIIKSGILFHDTSDSKQYENVLDIVYDLAKKKPWLREQCGFALYQSLESPRTFAYAQILIDKLQSAGLAKTPEGIAIWIAVQKKFRYVTMPSGVWHDKSPLHPKGKSKLALALKDASVSEVDDAKQDTKLVQRGSWSANVHFAWLVVITELISRSESKQKTKSSEFIDFGDFWRTCIEDGLFKSTSSAEKKYWGLVLFQRSLNIASTWDVISSLFSTKFIQCLTNHLASSDRYLHRAAEKAKKAIVERAQSSQEMRIMILKSLLVSGFIDFDKISKTHTIEELLVGLNEPSTIQICEIYNAVILQPGKDDEKFAAQRRQIAADQLVAAIKSMRQGLSKAQLDEASERSIRAILSLLARFAYFDLGSDAKPDFSLASHNLFKSRLSSSLTYLTGHVKDAFLFSYSLISILKEPRGVPDNANLLLEVENAVQEMLDRSVETMQSIHVRVNSGQQAAEGFLKSALLLMSLTFLQVHNNEVDAAGMLEELNEVFSESRLKHHEKQNFGFSAALTEILLGLVAKPSKLFRRVVQQVFETISADIEEDSIQSMLEVLKTKENWEGQEALFDQVAGDDQGNNEGSEDDEGTIESNTSGEDMSDVRIVQREDILSKAAGELDSPSVEDMSDVKREDLLSEAAGELDSSSVEDMESEDGTDDELAAFNTKLAQALGTRPGNEDLNAEDSDNADEDMNDEEMAALDTHLEKVFREQKIVASKKMERKDARKTIVDFKCSVLELLEIFVKKQHRSILALRLISPLLALLRTTSAPQVSQKAGDLLREYARLCKGKELPVIEDPQAVFVLLQSVHQEVLMQKSNAHASGCSQASLLLVKVLAAHDADQLSRVADVYGSTFSASQKKALAEKDFKVKISFFMDFNNWVSSLKR